MFYFQIVILIYIVSMFVYLLHNYRGYIELPPPAVLPPDPPSISVILPLPSDIEALRQCLSSLGRQDYPNFEVLVVSSSESPTTAMLIKDLAQEYSTIRGITVGPSPPEWSGKTYAQHQAALQARGDWLLFLDADLVVQPQCFSRCVAYCLEQHIDFFSLMPGHEMRSPWEKLILPIVFGWFGTRFSVDKVNDPKSTQAVAVHNFMLIRKTAYQTTGGFQTVKEEILEDSALSREIKKMGLTYRLVGGRHLITSRTRASLPEIWQRCMRMFVGEVGDSPLAILWTLMVIGITGILPFASVLWFAYQGFDSVDYASLLVSVLQCIVVLSARVVLDYILGIGPWYAFLHPIGAIATVLILLSSLAPIARGSLAQPHGRVSSELREEP